MSKRRKPRIISASRHGIRRNAVSRGAQRALAGLTSAGYRAEMVGGCVRDLLRGASPKDFDISTNARPEQVRELFRSSRIIGRRFLIVQIRFSGEFVEITTYRMMPNTANQAGRRRTVSQRGRILRDNRFGTIDQDAFRRDFTMNALYLRAGDFAILDYVNGYRDIQDRVIRTIGKPSVRFREDPVRMLRAIRFAATLDFDIEPNTGAAIQPLSHMLEDIPRARLADELKKLLFGGYAQKFFQLSMRFGLFSRLFPVYSMKFSEASEPAAFRLISLLFESMDMRFRSGEPLSVAYTFATILWPKYKKSLHPSVRYKKPARQRGSRVANQILSAQAARIHIPAHHRLRILEIWELQHRLERENPLTSGVYNHRCFRAALRLFTLRSKVDEVDSKAVKKWKIGEEQRAVR